MTNLEKAIAVMERVKTQESGLDRKLFDFRYFQGFRGSPLWEPHEPIPMRETEEEILNHCGTTCCFAGWLVASPEFKGINLEFWTDGSIQTKTPLEDSLVWEIVDGSNSTTTAYVIAEALGIPLEEADGLIYNTDLYYGKSMGEITPQDVIDKLNSFLPQS